jgi:hypothetical protein
MITTYTNPDMTTTSDSGRLITMRWLRPEAPIRRKGSAACEVVVSHDKERKCYRVSMSVCEVEGIWVSSLIGRGHYLTLHTESAARFSRAKLEDLARQARVIFIPDAIAHDPRAAMLYSGQPFEAAA